MKLLSMLSLLFPLAISAFSASPDQLLTEALQAGRKNLTLPPGTYKLDQTWNLRNLHDFTIDGSGATLLLSRSVSAVAIENCERLTLRNLVIDYDPVPFTQGTVVAVPPDDAPVKIRLHAGYPRLKPGQKYKMFVFEPQKRYWKPNTPDFYSLTPTPADHPDEVQIRTRQPLKQYLAPGDLVALCSDGGVAVPVKRTGDLVVENLTIHASPGAAVLGRFNHGKHRYQRLTVSRGPLPARATEPRLISTAADAFNHAYCEIGPDLIDSDIAWQGDDGVNYHSVAMPVIEQCAPTEIIALRPQPPEAFSTIVKPGMKMRILRDGDFQILGTALIKQIQAVDHSPLPSERIVCLFPPQGRDSRQTFYRITLQTPTVVPANAFIDIPAISGSGFTIRGNHFHDHRARGIRMMASGGLIENNRFERIKQNAITIGAEYSFWREAGYAENVTVRHNRIEDVGTGVRMTIPESYACGAISTFVRPEPGVHQTVPGNRNIVIENNLIDGCSGAGIFLHAVDGATINNNRIVNVLRHDCSRAGSTYGFKVDRPITTTRSAINLKIDGQARK